MLPSLPPNHERTEAGCDTLNAPESVLFVDMMKLPAEALRSAHAAAQEPAEPVVMIFPPRSYDMWRAFTVNFPAIVFPTL